MEAIRAERSAGWVTVALDRPATKNANDRQTGIERGAARAALAQVPIA